MRHVSNSNSVARSQELFLSFKIWIKCLSEALSKFYGLSWRATAGLCYLIHVYVICLVRWSFLISKTQSLFLDSCPVLRVVNKSQHTVFDQQMFSGGDKDLVPPFSSYLSATSGPAGLCLCSTSSCVELLSSPSSSSLSLLSSLVSWMKRLQ